MLVSGRKNCKHPRSCFSNHGHGDVLLTAVRGRSLWSTPLLRSRVRHTDRPLNAPQGIRPCLWVANSRSQEAQQPVNKNMNLIFWQRYITLASTNSHALSDAHTDISLVSVALRLCQYALLWMLTMLTTHSATPIEIHKRAAVVYGRPLLIIT